MTREYTQKILPLMQAFVSGKDIQFRKNQQGEWYDAVEPDWYSDFEYRIKPEVEYRPWTTEEVPVGALIKNKSNPYWKSLITFCWGQESNLKDPIIKSGEFSFSARELKNYLYSTDCGKTWQPCGVKL